MRNDSHSPPRGLYRTTTETDFAGLVLFQQLFAHNLTRELQMMTTPPVRRTTPGRTALWTFERLDTLRNTLLHRAGRLTRPQGVLTLTLNANAWLRERLTGLLHPLQTLRPTA